MLLMGNSTISMAMFNSYVTNYQRVNQLIVFELGFFMAFGGLRPLLQEGQLIQQRPAGSHLWQASLQGEVGGEFWCFFL